ncbi:MAG: hypothetical protein LBP23_00620 [Treponema sp.]|jgi:hypothetical protein|nr:hypothetical protein [Treponema sp.]
MKTIFMLMMAVLFGVTAGAEQPEAVNTGPLANYLSIPMEKAYAADDVIYVQCRDGEGRTVFLRLDQKELTGRQPKAAETQYSLVLKETARKEYAPRGSISFQADLKPKQRFVSYRWVLARDGETKPLASSGDGIVLDDLEPGRYTLRAQAAAARSGKELAAAAAGFVINGLPTLGTIIRQKAFSEDYTEREVEISPSLTPRLPSGFGATTYTFTAAGEAPVTGNSLSLRLRPDDPSKEVQIRAVLANGEVLHTTVSASATAAPPVGLTLSRGAYSYSTTKADVEIRAEVQHGRGKEYGFTWHINQIPQPEPGTALLKLEGLEWDKTYAVAAAASSGGETQAEGTLILKVPPPSITWEYLQGELAGDDVDIRECHFGVSLNVRDPENCMWKYYTGGKPAGDITGESSITLNLEAGVHTITAEAVNKATGKTIAKGSLPITVEPGPPRINPFVAELQGLLGGTDNGRHIRMECVFSGPVDGVLKGPVRTSLTGPGEALFVVDLTRQGSRGPGSRLEGTLDVIFRETTVKSSEGERVTGAVTSYIRVPLAGGFDEKEKAEVVTGVLRGIVSVALNGDGRIHGKILSAELTPQLPIRFVITDEGIPFNFRFTTGAMKETDLKKGEAGGGTAGNIVETAGRPPFPAKTGTAVRASSGRDTVPPPAAPPGEPQRRPKRRLTVAPGLGAELSVRKSLGPHDHGRIVVFYRSDYSIKLIELVVLDRGFLPLPSQIKKDSRRIKDITEFEF